MKLLDHFKRECEILGWNNGEDKMQEHMVENIEEILEVISKQGHSGFSIMYLMQLLNKAVMYEPLSPLTGKSDEWEDISYGLPEFKNLFQNKRDSRVFKDGERTYAIDVYVFKQPNGIRYTSHLSQKDITFPYTPSKPADIDVPMDASDEVIKAKIAEYEREIQSKKEVD